jgi:hypothetical protein
MLTKFGFSQLISMKVFNIELHKNPPIGSRVCRGGRQTDGQTDLTKVIGAFRDFREEARRYDFDMVFIGVIVIPN